MGEREVRIIVCPATCWGCKFDDHLPTWHSWADGEDIAWAKSSGKPDPSDQKCGCYCCKDAEPPAVASSEQGRAEGEGR